MNSTLEYLARKYELDLSPKPPIAIEQTNRTIMAQTLAELGFTVGAEIGVAQGHHSLVLCQNIPGLHLYAVDVWEPYDGYYEYQDRITRYHQEAIERLAGYNVTYVQKYSMDAVKDFADGSLDFVYIDGAHDFRNVVDDLCEWSKKVKVGGIVYGHDYKRRHDVYVIEVKDAVQAFCYTKGIRPWFVLGQPGNHVDGKFREGGQSWMFVRQEGDHVIWKP